MLEVVTIEIPLVALIFTPAICALIGFIAGKLYCTQDDKKYKSN